MTYIDAANSNALVPLISQLLLAVHII